MLRSLHRGKNRTFLEQAPGERHFVALAPAHCARAHTRAYTHTIPSRPVISLEERRAKGEAAREVAKEGPTLNFL